MSFERRQFEGAAAQTVLVGGVNAAAEALMIANATGWPDGSTGDFFIVVDPGTLTTASTKEEKIRCSSRSGTAITVAADGRGADDTTAQAHTNGATVTHVLTALDGDEANYWAAELAAAYDTAGDLAVADGDDSLTTLAKGANSTFLGVTSGGVQSYRKVAAADVAADIATQAELDADAAALAGHIADATAAHAASAVAFTPVGTIAGDDVQEAVAEVATDAATALSTHAADETSVHGVADMGELVTNASLTSTLDAFIPVGLALPFFGAAASVPDGWILYAGQTITEANSPELFAMFGATMPDMRGRVPVGLDNMGGSDAGRLSAANTLEGSGGSETQATSSNSPVSSVANLQHAHSHPNDDLTPSATGGMTVNATHSHTTFVDNLVDPTAGKNLQPYILCNYIGVDR